MKILSILAQKPNSTGSGIFLTELVNGFSKLNCKQAVIAGISEDDRVILPEDVLFYPVHFDSEALPFPVVGMSDVMPYKSTRYKEMTPEMTQSFKEAFLAVIDQAISEFKPDLLLCHHLYYLTALVRERYKKLRIIGLCHNTDLRQLEKTAFMKEFILSQISQVDEILCLNEAQALKVQEVFGTEKDRVHVTGAGYNENLFYPGSQSEAERKGQLIYAGKIAYKKGVGCLLKALQYLPYEKEDVTVTLVGDGGDEKEFSEIRKLAQDLPYQVEFTGALSQGALAEHYRQSEVFVLPSFSEGLSLTMMEAIACGCKVVISDLPGIKEWLAVNIPGSVVEFVTLPMLYDNDEARAEDLSDYERRIAAGIEKIREREYQKVEMKSLSWLGICKKVLHM
ncbi:glycosyltransferase family 4 protein [Ohessyouella blattaphilus]|uniref:Glycosyltransferase family 4 protein n=1 Tax=Ohessyouella blattaphilus TaxID=2949333 RepID=A0ABT1EHE9_9FIRM|nr:glycosyltransferase family 4 protein [Ohessyouella blattaphilus]MCP1110125.1 glycosyltransferase family 4 protein [Ohessyouella blattaphilus]MCR8563519.1 glycosyltransferase family 4 protein [Ohessyouella blattaphilus]